MASATAAVLAVVGTVLAFPAPVSAVVPDLNLVVVAGTGGVAGPPTPGAALGSKLNAPTGMAFDPQGNLYLTEQMGCRVDKITPGGQLSVLAGKATCGMPTLGVAADSQLMYLSGIAYHDGDLYFADVMQRIIYKIDAAGTLSKFAGSGVAMPARGMANGAALTRDLGSPGLLTVAGDDLYFGDGYHYQVAKIDLDTAQLTVLAGTGTVGGTLTSGPALSTNIGVMSGIAVAADGAVYASDFEGRVIYRISGGQITMVSNLIPVGGPMSLALDDDGVLYTTLWTHHRVARIDTTTGAATMVAGTGTESSVKPVDGPALAAVLGRPTGVAFAPDGGMYVAGQAAHVIARLDPPTSVPDAPAPTAVQAGPGEVAVTWTAPGDDGGDPITSYLVQAYQGGVAAAGRTCTLAAPFTPPLRCTVAGLTPGTAYTFRVTATNGVGAGAESVDSTAATPFAVPGAPVPGAVAVSSAQATVGWAAPASDGGSPVTSYTVQAYVNGTAAAGRTCTVSPAPPLRCTVTGLTNGTAYTFRITAANLAGAGPQSADSSPATPQVGVPGAPLTPAAVGAPGQASVTWTAPASDGGSTVTSYTVQAYVNGTAAAGRTCTGPVVAPLRCTVTELVNGTAYTFRVTATNSAGTGPASVDSAAVTPAAVAPDAPAAPTAVPGNAQATVTWTAPASDGGSAVTSYTAQASPGGATCTAAALSCVITGLANGTAYEVRVTATNAAGTSAASGPVTVTPLAPPAAPTAVTASGGTSSITATWTASAAGAAAVTGYTASAEPGPATCTTLVTDPDPTSCVLGGVAGTTYTVTVVANSASGASGPSAGSNPATVTAPVPPATPPATPLELTTDKGRITTAEPGQQIVVIGTGFAPHSTATITIYSTPTALGTVVTDGAGNFSKPVTVPAGLAAGGHTVVAQGVDTSGNAHAMRLDVTVAAAGSDDLAVTGTDAARLVTVGLLTVAAGLLLVRFGGLRRPRRTHLLPIGAAHNF